MHRKLKGLRTMLVMVLAAIPPMLEALVQIALLPEWGGLIPDEWWPFYAIAVAIAGVVLRTITDTPFGRQEPRHPEDW